MCNQARRGVHEGGGVPWSAGVDQHPSFLASRLGRPRVSFDSCTNPSIEDIVDQAPRQIDEISSSRYIDDDVPHRGLCGPQGNEPDFLRLTNVLAQYMMRKPNNVRIATCVFSPAVSSHF